MSDTNTCDYIKCHFLKILSMSTCLCHVCVSAYSHFCFDSTLMQTKGHKQKEKTNGSVKCNLYIGGICFFERKLTLWTKIVNS